MLLFLAAVVIGSQACRPCHSAIANSYAQTPMARSSGPIESISLTPANVTAAGQRYQVSKNQLSLKEAGAEIIVPMSFFIGSGAAGRSFLFARDRYLFELPVAWYARKNRWDASPGYESEPGVKLNRAIEPTCLFYHSSQVRPIFGTQNRYAEKPFLEGGVCCERCHGPGSQHASALFQEGNLPASQAAVDEALSLDPRLVPALTLKPNWQWRGSASILHALFWSKPSR